MTNIELVSVTYGRGKQGDRRIWNFDDWQINNPDPDEWPEDIAGFDWQGNQIPTAHIMDTRFGGVYINLPTDWFGFRFQCFGQFFEGQCSGLECEVENNSAADTFGDFVKTLKAIGDRLLDGEVPFDRDRPKEVTFLTAWKYCVSKGWEGEIDVDYDLIGLIDVSRIQELIVKEAANV